MLATARSVAPPAARIEWHEATAEAMPLPDEAFDVVICQLGLMFVPDKPAALREMRRVLVGGGRLLVSVPGPTPPIFAIMDEALARHVGVELAGFVRIVFSMHDPDALRGLLTRAGFRDVRVEREMRTLPLAPPKEFLWQYIHSTPLAGAVSAAGPERRAAFEREVLPRWQEFVRDGKLQFDVGITVGTARK
jgi:SAM-dependent methyltransferase